MCRLFERILADGINYFLYQNRLISAAQYGFVKGRSMEVQLLHCTNLRVKAIDNKRFVDTVYIDFGKAFDTVSHASDDVVLDLQCRSMRDNLVSFLGIREKITNTGREKVGIKIASRLHDSSLLPTHKQTLP